MAEIPSSSPSNEPQPPVSPSSDRLLNSLASLSKASGALKDFAAGIGKLAATDLIPEHLSQHFRKSSFGSTLSETTTSRKCSKENEVLASKIDKVIATIQKTEGERVSLDKNALLSLLNQIVLAVVQGTPAAPDIPMPMDSESVHQLSGHSINYHDRKYNIIGMVQSHRIDKRHLALAAHAAGVKTHAKLEIVQGIVHYLLERDMIAFSEINREDGTIEMRGMYLSVMRVG